MWVVRLVPTVARRAAQKLQTLTRDRDPGGCGCVCEWALVAAPPSRALLKTRNGACRLRRESGTVAVAKMLERGWR
ncbi:hypothetical protein EXIGLDRAFT_717182 [Exidia glandulosa HHB12029]|uniref:Uncharacterized protein n=1 Tax=Exidia glandulosa HHB12029 TaxID=1314781 RepID=A0A166MQP9_EXIGL|nr:hypothetical protein EXIGLDRAFT_717182 [Exidia glandulosa HHB12029]